MTCRLRGRKSRARSKRWERSAKSGARNGVQARPLNVEVGALAAVKTHHRDNDPVGKDRESRDDKCEQRVEGE